AALGADGVGRPPAALAGGTNHQDTKTQSCSPVFVSWCLGGKAVAVMALSILPITGMPMVQPGDDLAALLFAACDRSDLRLADGDILVVCQKVVSKAEGRVVDLRSVTASAFAEQLARQTDGKDPRVIELILRETKRIVRMDAGHLIVETGPGWVCANAGVDESNSGDPNTVVLLPLDPDASARRIAHAAHERYGCCVAVIITDTFGRPWRQGLVDFALGVAGLPALLDPPRSDDPAGPGGCSTTKARRKPMRWLPRQVW